jgi:WD40 repeat protein
VPSRVNTVAFSPDGTTLAAGSNDKMVRFYNVTNPARPAAIGAPLEAATGWVNALAYSSDGHTLAVGNADSTVQLWDVAARQLVATLPHPEPVTAVAFRDHDRALLTGSADGVARLWKVAGPAMPDNRKSITTVAIHPNGTLLAAAGTDVQLWNIADRDHPTTVGPPLTAPRGSDRLGGTVAISPDGHILAAGTRTGNAVVLWDITDPQRPRPLGDPLRGPTALIEQIRFSPDGALLAAGSDDGTVRLWPMADAGHLSREVTLSPGAGEVYAVAFSPDGSLLAAATSGGIIPVWRLDGPGREPTMVGTPLEASGDYSYSVAFSPDGHTLAAGNGDGTVQLWHLDNTTQPGRPVTRLTAPDGYVLALAFSTDGTLLAAGTGTGQTWLWDTSTPERPQALAVVNPTSDNVWTTVFAPDGHTIANASGGVRLLETDPERIAAQICRTAGDPITDEEWQRYAPGAARRPPCG